MTTYEILITQPGYDENPADGEGAQRITIENGTAFSVREILKAAITTTAEVISGNGLNPHVQALYDAREWDGETPITIDLAGHSHAVTIA